MRELYGLFVKMENEEDGEKSAPGTAEREDPATTKTVLREPERTDSDTHDNSPRG